MGNYFGGKKKEDGNDPTQDAFYGVEIKKRAKEQIAQTVYRPHIYIDFYKSQLFKDGDGGVAHEFWEQCDNGKVRKVKGSRLKSVGVREYEIPRLALTCPLVICDNETLSNYLKRKYNYIDKYPSDYLNPAQ